ncbi:MAG: translation initiation factor IF-2 [Rhodospirillaceae bacterium]|nr:translation initiation factor IF-2 [Rhodospirillaceae bacterium]
MKIQVHWIVDGRITVESDSLEDAEEKMETELREAILKIPNFVDDFGAISIQGKAYFNKDDKGTE